MKTKCKFDVHHWTLNHLEDGEKQTLTKEEHGKLHGMLNWCSDELSIRREIIYELRKVIALEDTIKVLEEVHNEWEEKDYGRKSDKEKEQARDRYRKNARQNRFYHGYHFE